MVEKTLIRTAFSITGELMKLCDIVILPSRRAPKEVLCDGAYKPLIPGEDLGATCHNTSHEALMANFNWCSLSLSPVDN